MPLNLQELSKPEIIKLGKTYCKHGGNYLSHQNCYLKEKQNRTEERVGFMDIECTELNPVYGILTTYCILDNDTGKIYSDTLTKADINKWSKKRGIQSYEDTRLLQNLVKDMRRFDRLVLHFGCYFDVSYVRTRAIICKVKHPEFGELVYSDTWKILRSKFSAMKSKSLENSLMALTGKTSKTKLNQRLKNGCIRGEKWALKEVLKHNRFDVIDTKKLYDIISPHIRKSNSTF